MYKIKIIIIAIISTVAISYSQFGKNKVQYDNFEWKYIQSAHFDVYYNKGSKYLAEFTAKSAEKALAAIQNTLNFKINARVVIVAYDSHNEFQQTNVISSFMPEGVGGVTELFKNRVVVPFQGDYQQYDHVIHHELVHAVLNDMFYGGTFQSAVMNSGGFMIPLWMNEGLAEWQSIGGMNTETDMFMRDLTISEELPQLDNLNGYLAYRGGQTFYWYIAEKYGKERVGDLLNRLKIHRNLKIAFESAFHVPFEDFSEKWQSDIKKYYLPDLEKYESPKDYAVQITDHYKERSFYNSSPAISPDGEKVAYISAKGGNFGIYVRKIDKKSEPQMLVNSFRSQDFEDLNMLTPGISWNPKGDKLAISAKSGGEDAIFIVDEKSGDYKKLLFGLKSISSVQWSPDGKKLAFIASIAEKSDIMIYDLDTKKITNLTNDIFTDKFAIWAPDSKSLYFISDRGENILGGVNKSNFDVWKHKFYSSDIYKIELENKLITRLTFDSENEKTSVAVTSDNSKLFYVSDKNGIGNLYLMNLNDLATKPITNSITGITQISLANDDSKLVFTTQIKGGYDLYLIKYPLERDMKMDELPITKFKKEVIEKNKILASIAIPDTFSIPEDNKLVGYGDFQIDFSEQQLVKANPDAQKKIDIPVPEEKTQDIAEFNEQDYLISFSPDVILGNPGYNTFYGFQGVTQMLFSDVLGDHQIYVQANLLTDLQNSQIFASYSNLSGIVDYRFAGYLSSGIAFLNDQNWYRFSNWGFGSTFSYPLSLFERFDLSASFMNIGKTNIQYPQLTSVSKYLIVPAVSYVFDNTLWGYYAPREGARYNFTIQGSPTLGDNGVGFATFTTDMRYYLPLNDYLGFAFRGAGGASFGPNPQRFFLGGTDNWINRRFKNNTIPFNEPEDFAFMNFETPMRGWAIADIYGEKYFLGNIEFRFPMFTALVAGPIPILLQGIMGSFFLDVGGAWDDSFEIYETDVMGKKTPKNMLVSTGIGIRSYFLGLPVKLDIAWRHEYDTWSVPQYMFSLGYDF